MAKVGVFLGSATPSEKYSLSVERLGKYIAQQGHSTVCGANGGGLMGTLIDAALRNSGEVLGILPTKDSSNEIPHKNLTHVRSVTTSSERKELIRDLSDVIIVCPGGLGTLDELFEALALKRLGKFRKPIGLLNICGFYDPLLNQIDNLVHEGFAKEKHRNLVVTGSNPAQLIDLLLSEIEFTDTEI